MWRDVLQVVIYTTTQIAFANRQPTVNGRVKHNCQEIPYRDNIVLFNEHITGQVVAHLVGSRISCSICHLKLQHHNDVIMDAIASQITSLTIVYSTVYSDADQRKHQSSSSLAFVLGIHRWPVKSPHKWPVTRKMFPFDEVIMGYLLAWCLPVLSCPVLSRFRLHRVVLIFICTIFKRMSVCIQSAYLYHVQFGLLHTIRLHTPLLSVPSISGSGFFWLHKQCWRNHSNTPSHSNSLLSESTIFIDEYLSLLIQVITHQTQCWFIAN